MAQQTYVDPLSRVSIDLPIKEKDSSINDSPVALVPTIEDQDNIDGGYAWVIVASSFTIHFIVLGIEYTFGVYLKHYLANDFSDTSKSELSMIGSIATAILSAGGIFAGRMADHFGYRPMAFLGTLIFSIGLILASFSTKSWHLILTQGVVMGIGSSIAFFPAVSIPSQYFVKRRGLATGICVSGTGIGGLILSPITQILLDNLGFRWTLRIMGILALVVGGIASIFLKQRIPSKKGGKLVNWSIFKDKRFLTLFTGGFISSLGYLIPFFMMPLYAEECGLSNTQSAILLGILNAGNAIGRVGLGFLADKAGKINVMSVGIFCTGLFCLIIWMFSTTFPSLLVFSIFYGSVAGSFISLLPVTSSFLFGVENIASINGLLYVSNGVPNFIGTPIATALGALSATKGPSSYLPVILFAGFAGVVGSFFIFWLKAQVGTKLLSKV